jgi:lysozyme
MIDPRITKQLFDSEDYRACVYKDSKGFWTVGIGFLVDDRVKGAGLSLKECEVILRMRLEELHFEILPKRIPWIFDLSLPRQAVLVDMAYNMGWPSLLGFKKMLMALRRSVMARSVVERDAAIAEAVAEMFDSKWAREDVPSRAARLAKQMATGEWQ